MKRIFTFLFALTVAVSTLSGAQFTDVSAAEVIEISNVADLMCIADRPDADYRLANDIDMEALDDLDGFEWESIPSFSGNFYGDGHSITVIDEPLFGTIESGATVQDLGVLTADMIGDGVMAKIIKGDVKRCGVTGYGRIVGMDTRYDVARGEYVGGFAGLISGGTVSDCYASLKIIGGGSTPVGAIAGKAENAKILRCYSDSDVKGGAEYAGALIGDNSGSEVTDCYYCYYNKDNTELRGVGSGKDNTIGVSAEGHFMADSFAGFDFTNVWHMVDGIISPSLISINGAGTEDNPYRIHNAEDFNRLIEAGSGTENAGMYYKLEADVDAYMKSLKSYEISFSGFFDGGNHSVRNISDSLFYSILPGAEVKNIIIVRDEDRMSSDESENIAHINYGVIENCHTSEVEIEGGNGNHGGIAGDNLGGAIRGCSVTAASVWPGDWRGDIRSGGIAGYNSGVISECVVRGGSVVCRTETSAAGGIAGENSDGLIENCIVWNTDLLFGMSENGGIVGRLSSGSLKNCYVNQSSVGDGSYGAVAGYVVEGSSIESCYYNLSDMQPCISADEYKIDANCVDSKDILNLTGFDFENVWTVDADGNIALAAVTGRGDEDDPYIVRDKYDLKNIDDGIDASGKRNYYILNNNIYSLRYDYSDSFSGSFNGQGHFIKYNSVTENLASGGYISNIIIYGGRAARNISGGTVENSLTILSGGFVETLDGGSIANCAAVGGTVLTYDEAGGFATQVLGGSIKNCYTRDVNVRGGGGCGGFVGNNSGGAISYCYVYGGNISASLACGGFAGNNENKGIIENCGVRGAEIICRYQIGAFVGLNYATIQNVFADNSEVAAFAGIDDGISSNISLSSDGGVMRTEFIKTASTNLIVNDTTIYIPTDRPTTQNVLADIDGHWAEVTIRNLVEKGVVNGYKDGTFRPEENATKGEYIKLLMTAAEEGTSGAFTNYPDVNESWAKGYIARAVDLGICDNINTSEESFGVDEPITRAQAATLMGRLFAPNVTGTPEFTDSADIPDWASDPIYASAQLGLIEGDDGAFRAMDNLTRAEAATIIARVINYIG